MGLLDTLKDAGAVTFPVPTLANRLFIENAPRAADKILGNEEDPNDAIIQAQREAAVLQQQSNQAAIDEQRRQFDLNRGDLTPFRETGVDSLNRLSQLVFNRDPQARISELSSNFQASPGHDFILSEGLKALDRSAAARGRLGSGRHNKDLLRFSQGLASTEFDNFLNRGLNADSDQLNRLAALAGVGQTATNTGIGAGTNAANSISTLLQNTGNTAANSLVNQGNARASSIQAQNDQFNNLLNNAIFLGLTGGSIA